MAKGTHSVDIQVEIPACPLCLQDEDSLEHLIRCTYSTIRDDRIHFKQLINLDIANYGRKHEYSQDAIKLAQEYATACGDMRMDAFDCVGGRLAIPTPRFLFRYSPDTMITSRIYRDLAQLLPSVISEHLKWLLRIWKTRCTLVHTRSNSNTQSISSSATSSQFVTTLSAFHTTTSRRTRRTHQSLLSDNNLLQTSILPFTADPRPEDGDEDTKLLTIASRTPTSQSDHLVERDLSPAPSTFPRRGRFTLWNLRGSTQLLEDPSSCPARPVAYRWDQLPGDYEAAAKSPGYNLPSLNQLRIGPSTLPGAGLGCFLNTENHNYTTGTVLGIFWGPSTANQGLPASILEPGADIPAGVRDDGAYLLRHGPYMVDADPDCAMGYVNEPKHMGY